MERYEKIQLELLEKLKTELTKTSFDAWTKDMEIYKLDDELGIAYIALCESKYNNVEMALNILQSRYLHLIEECLEKVIGQKYRIVIKTLSEYENTDKNNVKQATNVEPKKVNLNLMSNYTFETFVVGSNNKFAHAAALAVANSPAEAFNPVYIYGSSGLGKTHLLQAIGNHLSITRPELNIIYISAEKFTTEFIMSIKQNKTYEFKRKYRGADVLLIDDIQFFGRAKESQEEFFHTFNELYEGKKQIVITSDCEPSKLDNLQDRLKTRFHWNMIADIFARIGYMERQGSGLSKICTTYENAVNYKPSMEPTFRSNRVEFTVKLPNLNFKASNGEALNEALNEALTENQKLLLDILRNNPAITQKQMIENTTLSRSTVQRVMKDLTDQGYIERVGSKKSGSWIVKK